MMLAALLLAAAPMTDTQLATQIHNVNQLEIDVGKIGEKNCQSAQCKDLATMIKSDHQKADEKITGIVKPDDKSLPAEVKEQNKSDKSRADGLKDLKGAQFDKAFAQMMFEGHQGAIRLLQDNQDAIQNPQLKSFVADTLPALQKHEDLARQVMSGAPKAQGRAPEPTNR